MSSSPPPAFGLLATGLTGGKKLAPRLTDFQTHGFPGVVVKMQLCESTLMPGSPPGDPTAMFAVKVAEARAGSLFRVPSIGLASVAGAIRSETIRKRDISVAVRVDRYRVIFEQISVS